MYLAHLKSMLSSGQVSQYVPSKQGRTLVTGEQSDFTLLLPSRKRQFRKGAGKVYFSLQQHASSTQENQKFDCVDFSISTLSSSIFTILQQRGNFSNSGTAGYLIGGTDSAGNPQTTISKFTYSTETATNLSAVLSGTGRVFAQGSNNAVAGYVLGSALGSLGTAINKLTYSSDTRTTLSAVTSQSRYGDAGFSNSGTAVYRCFGEA